jgi:hypothetical protein
MVIGCCDSRVSPEVIFDACRGELFVVRNVANVTATLRPMGASIDEDAELLRRRDVIHNWIRLNGTGGRKVGPRGALSHEDHLMRLTASIT